MTKRIQRMRESVTEISGCSRCSHLITEYLKKGSTSYCSILYEACWWYTDEYYSAQAVITALIQCLSCHYYTDTVLELSCKQSCIARAVSQAVIKAMKERLNSGVESTGSSQIIFKQSKAWLKTIQCSGSYFRWTWNLIAVTGKSKAWWYTTQMVNRWDMNHQKTPKSNWNGHWNPCVPEQFWAVVTWLHPCSPLSISITGPPISMKICVNHIYSMLMDSINSHLWSDVIDFPTTHKMYR